MAPEESRSRPRLFAPFPTHGIWTALDLSRAQFLTILSTSLIIFTFAGGTVWAHARESHFWRMSLSYLVIPPMVGWALWRNEKMGWSRFLVGSAVIAAIKLVLTAIVLVAIGVSR